MYNICRFNNINIKYINNQVCEMRYSGLFKLADLFLEW